MVRGFVEPRGSPDIQELLEQELTAALGRSRCERASGEPKSYRNGTRERQLLGSFGPVEVAVPRARLAAAGGGTAEWRSTVPPRYARMMRQVEALIAGAYLAGTNTRQFLVTDGAAGLERALAALWPEVPAQRRMVHKYRNLLGHAPDALHEEITADYTDMVYADTPKAVQERRRAFLRKWRLRCPAVATSLEKAGDRLFAFLRLPSPLRSVCEAAGGEATGGSQWKSARTTNAVERLHAEFKRRVKTQTVLPPSAETAAMLFWALMASGQITMRKVDGWQTLDEKLADPVPVDLAA